MLETYKRIERLCKDKGVNITRMCKEAGVTRANLSDFKYGRKKSLGVQTLTKIAEYFGVSVDYLLDIEQEKKPTVKDDELERKKAIMLEKFTAAPPDVQEMILRTMFIIYK